MRSGLHPLFLGLVVGSAFARQIPLTASALDDYSFNPLLHLPGIGPYFDAIGAGLAHGVPLNCKVTAASYLIRHAAIYANDDDFEKYIEPFIEKWQRHPSAWSGPLKFLNKWENPIDDPESQLEEVTPHGKYESRDVGRRLLDRYPDLAKTVKTIYADGKSRTYDTAKSLVESFPQHKSIKIVKIVTDKDGAMDSQVPHKSCPAFSKEPGDKELARFISTYTPPIVERLNFHSPVALSESDIFGMQMLCGYETSIFGKTSQFCRVFSDTEFFSFEYGLDLKYAHMVGHFNPLSPYLGFPWLNTTSGLFDRIEAGQDDDDGQRLFISATHREVPPFVVTALGLFNSSSSEDEEFPTDRINWSRAWKMSELIPFLGHVGLEKMSCESGNGRDRTDYIRVIANSAPRPIPNCALGPGGGCLLRDFKEILKQGMDRYGDFHAVCGPSPK